MKISEALLKAAALIEPPGAWTQGAFARTKDGFPIGPESQTNAVCFCVTGAIRRVVSDAGGGSSGPARWFIQARRRLGMSPERWNDDPHTTQNDVVAELRNAAAQALEEGN